LGTGAGELCAPEAAPNDEAACGAEAAAFVDADAPPPAELAGGFAGVVSTWAWPPLAEPAGR
jgi:hypothetical protein